MHTYIHAVSLYCVLGQFCGKYYTARCFLCGHSVIILYMRLSYISVVILQVTPKYCVQSETVSPHQDEVCPVWGSCARSPAVLCCCSFGGVCWVPFQQSDTPGASHPIILLLLLLFFKLSCEHFTTFRHWWQRNDRVQGKSQLNAECKCYFAYTTPAPPALLQCPNALIARSSVLGGIMIFKLELYVLRYLRTYLVCYCMTYICYCMTYNRSTIHGSLHTHTVERECIYIYILALYIYNYIINLSYYNGARPNFCSH